MYERIVVLIDMDCFYVQVEQKLNPELRNQPCVVVQKTWKGGSIIAVNYEARACGVTRGSFGKEAQLKCPDLKLARVPEVRGKSDLTRYRDSSKDVFSVLTQFTDQVEKASIDEAFIDVTDIVAQRMKSFEDRHVTLDDLPSTCVIREGDDQGDKQETLGKWLRDIYGDETFNSDGHQLAVAAVVVEEIRATVLMETTFKCSAGIAENKMLAKYICGLNKPNRQTILPRESLPYLFSRLPLTKIRNLGGKFGSSLVEAFRCQTMADLGKISRKQLEERFGDKTGSWLFNLGLGVDNDPVNPRQAVKSIGCSKHFFGKSALTTKDQVKHWLMQFAEEIVERGLADQEANKRIAKTLTVSAQLRTTVEPTHLGRSCPLTVYDPVKISQDAFVLLQKLNKSGVDSNRWNPAILVLSMSVGKFQDLLQANKSIHNFFKQDIPGSTQGCSEAHANASLPSASKERSNTVNKLAEPVREKTSLFHRTNPINDEDTSGSKQPRKGFFETKFQNRISPIQDWLTNVETSRHLSNKSCTLAKNEPIDENVLLELPEDIRNEIATQLQPNQPASKEPNNKIGIAKYMKALAAEPNDNGEKCCSSLESMSEPNLREETYLCDDCNRLIPIASIFEHQDFHFARKLQNDFNKDGATQNSADVAHQPAGKRKSSDQLKSLPKKQGAIDAYFSVG